MGDRYWVWHPSLSGFVGPLTVSDLRASVGAGSLPVDASVRLAAADGRPEVLDDRGWSPLHELLGLEPPPRPQGPPQPEPVIALPAPGVPGVRLDRVLVDLRGKSSYLRARKLATLLLVVALIGVSLGVLVGLGGAIQARSLLIAVVALGGGCLDVAAVLVAYQAFVMLADLADCHLRRETERAARSVSAPQPGS